MSFFWISPVEILDDDLRLGGVCTVLGLTKARSTSVPTCPKLVRFHNIPYANYINVGAVGDKKRFPDSDEIAALDFRSLRPTRPARD